jgi:hypothetical protein
MDLRYVPELLELGLAYELDLEAGVREGEKSEMILWLLS